MPWPDDDSVRRAAKVIAYDLGVGGEATDVARRVLKDAGLPELVGNKQAAALLSVGRGNLGRVANLPAPAYDDESVGQRLWLRADIEQLAEERARNGSQVVLRGRAPGGAAIIERTKA